MRHDIQLSGEHQGSISHVGGRADLVSGGHGQGQDDGGGGPAPAGPPAAPDWIRATKCNAEGSQVRIGACRCGSMVCPNCGAAARIKHARRVTERVLEHGGEWVYLVATVNRDEWEGAAQAYRGLKADRAVGRWMQALKRAGVTTGVYLSLIHI